MRMGLGVRTGLGHGSITCVLQTHFSSLQIFLCSPTTGEGGHISFSADPGRQCRRDSLVSTISLESIGGILPDLLGYIIGTSQKAD